MLASLLRSLAGIIAPHGTHNKREGFSGACGPAIFSPTAWGGERMNGFHFHGGGGWTAGLPLGLKRPESEDISFTEAWFDSP